jgi:hypothetical protein
MCVIITYPVRYFKNNWFADLFEGDARREAERRIQYEELYYTPRVSLTAEEFGDMDEAQEEINEDLNLPKLDQQNVLLNDAIITKNWKGKKYFLKCFMIPEKGYGVILNICDVMRNKFVEESRKIDGVNFYFYDKCKCPKNKINKIKKDIEDLNSEEVVAEVVADVPAVAPIVPTVPAEVIKEVVKTPKKIKIVKKKEVKEKIEPKPAVAVVEESGDLKKLKEYETLYKNKLTKKAKENTEYINLKYKSIPPKSHFIKDIPLKEGRKYLSTADRPMNGTIKRYIDMIYPEQKYANKMEEMIDKIRLLGLLMKNIEKERAKMPKAPSVAQVPAMAAKPAIVPAAIVPAAKKEIKKQQKEIPQVIPSKAIMFADLYKYFQDYMKKWKQGVKETPQDKKIKKQKIDDFRIYIRNLRNEKNATKNIFNKKDLEKQIKGYQELLNALSNRNPKLED